jgi:hypothetical protein
MIGGPKNLNQGSHFDCPPDPAVLGQAGGLGGHRLVFLGSPNSNHDLSGAV